VRKEAEATSGIAAAPAMLATRADRPLSILCDRLQVLCRGGIGPRFPPKLPSSPQRGRSHERRGHHAMGQLMP
jgi:hypothetical protein